MTKSYIVYEQVVTGLQNVINIACYSINFLIKIKAYYRLKEVRIVQTLFTRFLDAVKIALLKLSTIYCCQTMYDDTTIYYYF